jgi:two-component system, sensor histidine kinase and response regulator
MGPETSPSTAPVKILIAEDSPTQALRLRHILEQQGYEVGVAGNGCLALAMASDFRPALIISDVVMPEMDGYELSRRLKADADFCDIPVILVTTLSDPEDVIRGLACGADHFVLKPYDEHYLLGHVQDVLVNRRICREEDAAMGVAIHFNGQRHFINAGRRQILNLLLSTYAAAIQRNKELDRSQEKLQWLNAKFEAANNELESFSYSVSHDLRAPLRHIDAFAGLLEQRAADTLDSKSRDYLQTIAECAKQMGRLIDDLLAFARMGRAEMMQREMEMESLVQETIRGLELETQGRQIRWKIAPLPLVQADPAMMRQVLVNLLGNAVKYTRTRDVAEIEVGVQDAANEIVLFIRDNGVGFDMQYADKLFGVFQRLHHADDFEGTGVGLANVRRIIARHGGRTWADGKVGAGATMFFSLPKSQAS